MADQKLTQEQIDQRIAILKKFRQLLEQQRQKFREYLVVLEKQEQTISSENIDAMVTHTEIEQSIITEIYTIQKVIDPLEAMYRDIHHAEPDAEIPRLKADLGHLQKEVVQQNEKNRELLKTHMQVLRQKVISIHNPYANRSSIYASDAHTASIIDINQ
jgi:hypothetical protein